MYILVSYRRYVLSQTTTSCSRANRTFPNSQTKGPPLSGDVISKLKSDVRIMTIEEGELRAEVAALKDQLSVEELFVEKVSMEADMCLSEKQLLVEANNKSKNHLDALNQFSETVRKNSVLFHFYNKYAEAAQPSRDKQQESIREMQMKHEKTLSHYEENPIYKQILEENIRIGELTQSLAELKDKYVQLEAQQAAGFVDQN